VTTPQSERGAHTSPAERLIDAPDRRDGLVYVITPEIQLAVDVALATGRPLLLRGEPGSGKSSLAAYVARQRGWRYYEHVITSRTQARDLLSTFDTVRRLADAEIGRKSKQLNDADYVEPGVLWWAFAPGSARRRGNPQGGRRTPPAVEPNETLNANRSAEHAVVLIDEIDKADPDLPNGLLVPLGSSEFMVPETGQRVKKEAPTGNLNPDQSRHLIMITTNEERELPQAFLRRCVVIWLRHPGINRLVTIARSHMAAYAGGMTSSDERLALELAKRVDEVRKEAKKQAIRPPSTAEYLDAVRACRALGITPDSDQWAQLRNLTLIKRQQPGPPDELDE
jgi:MoxR-like ATPase